MATLYVQEESGYRKASANDVIAQAQGLIARRFRVGSPVLSAPARVREFLGLHLGARDEEIFGVIHLDTRHRSLGIENLFRGTIDGAAVHPREVVKAVLARNAAALICFHNHPLC
jgi:DNA repair protein RadC